MVTLSHRLIRLIFPDISRFNESSFEADPLIRQKVGRFEGWLAGIANLVLFGIKLILGMAIQSIALMADAFHTLGDSVSSFAIIFVFKVSGKPPDEEHPYGHGRAEYIGTLILSMLIVVTGVEFIRSSAGRISTPAILNSSPLVMVIVLGTAVVKEIMARISRYLGTVIDSGVLQADAWHHRSDVFSSLAPIVSMVLANAGWQQWDGVLGIGVGLFIIWMGYSVGRTAIDSLLGSPPGPELVDKIRSIARSVGSVIDVHDIVVHSYGVNRFISLHMEVDQNESQVDSHELASRAMGRLREALHAHVTVHVDPVTTRGEQASDIRKALDELAEMNPEVGSYHDFRLVQAEDHKVILVKLALERDLSKEELQRLKKRFSKFLMSRFPDYTNRIRIISPVHRFGAGRG